MSLSYVNHFSAAVLAGGKSTRMGADKAGLMFRGMTLAAYQTAKLRALGLTDLMLSGWREAIEDARYVPDELPARGPLGGIHACLGAAEHDAVLFLSVDVPLVPVETMQALLDAHTGGMTLLSIEGVPQPLIGVYDYSLRAAAEEILKSENTAARRLFEICPPRLVEYTGDPGLIRNCNTPADYEWLLGKIPYLS